MSQARLAWGALLFWALFSGCDNNSHHDEPPLIEDVDPPEVQVGERLFLETRFAQFFAVNSAGDVNAPLAAGDPAVDTIVTTTGSLPGPFAGTSMNCRSCHLVDDVDGVPGGAIKTYTDFARRSPIPDRGDGRSTTPRNSPPLVNASITRTATFFLHFDAEFATAEDLVRGTFTGRNFGWRPDEQAAAIAHIAKVIRDDDGTGDLAADFGALSYAQTLDGIGVPDELLLPPAFQIDVTTATDQEILDAVAALVVAYTQQLEFGRDEDGAFANSPFDAFLRKNGLPTQPDPGESDLDFSLRLRGLVDALADPEFVEASEGTLTFHDQDFVFGADELAGLKVFLAQPAALPASSAELASGGIGNCIACHHAPAFTDFLLHNIGTTQAEYESIHGGGSFLALVIPDIATRDGDPDQFLPPSAANPSAEGVFLRVVDAADPRFTDLGAWNVFANPNVPAPQAGLTTILSDLSGLPPASPADLLLPFAIAIFKTPGLRDLGQGAPYMHTGQFDEIEDVLGHYLLFSGLARAGVVRNGDPELTGIALVGSDLAPVAAFLRSLNEDYN